MKKQYIRQVRKDLHIPRSAKTEVERDLQEIRQEQVQKKEERARQPRREHAAPSRSRKKKKQKQISGKRK